MEIQRDEDLVGGRFAPTRVSLRSDCIALNHQPGNGCKLVKEPGVGRTTRRRRSTAASHLPNRPLNASQNPGLNEPLEVPFHLCRQFAACYEQAEFHVDGEGVVCEIGT